MRQALRRGLLLLAAAMLGVGGTVLVAWDADANTFDTTVVVSSDMIACPGTCTIQTGDALAGDPVTDFCTLSAGGTNWDFIFNFSSGRRPGFVQRSTLRDTGQFTGCASGGSFNNVATTTPLRACAAVNCTTTGSATASHSLRDYCFETGQAVQGNSIWHAVYDAAAGQRVGFVPEALLNSPVELDRCDA